MVIVVVDNQMCIRKIITNTTIIIIIAYFNLQEYFQIIGKIISCLSFLSQWFINIKCFQLIKLLIQSNLSSIKIVITVITKTNKVFKQVPTHTDSQYFHNNIYKLQHNGYCSFMNNKHNHSKREEYIFFCITIYFIVILQNLT